MKCQFIRSSSWNMIFALAACSGFKDSRKCCAAARMTAALWYRCDAPLCSMAGCAAKINTPANTRCSQRWNEPLSDVVIVSSRIARASKWFFIRHSSFVNRLDVVWNYVRRTVVPVEHRIGLFVSDEPLRLGIELEGLPGSIGD